MKKNIILSFAIILSCSFYLNATKISHTDYTHGHHLRIEEWNNAEPLNKNEDARIAVANYLHYRSMINPILVRAILPEKNSTMVLGTTLALNFLGYIWAHKFLDNDKKILPLMRDSAVLASGDFGAHQANKIVIPAINKWFPDSKKEDGGFTLLKQLEFKNIVNRYIVQLPIQMLVRIIPTQVAQKTVEYLNKEPSEKN